MRSSARFVIVGAAVALAAAPAVARADAKALYAEGQDAYKKGNYAVAAAKFSAAYDADPDPVYLFNAAQAYRLGDDCVRAADFYQRFLAKVPNPPNADKIHGWADETAACARAKQPPPAPHPDRTPGTTGTSATPAPPAAQPATPPPAPAAAPTRSRVPGAVLLGTGVVGLVVGGVFAAGWHAAQADSDAVCNHCTVWDPGFNQRLADDKSRAKRDSALAISSFAVGGALVATGAVFLFVLDGTPAADRVTVAPTASGATVSTTFHF